MDGTEVLCNGSGATVYVKGTDSVHRGYVKLWRKIQDSDVWSDSTALHVWLYCLTRANYKQTKYRGTVIEPGQFVFGRESAGSALGIAPTTVRDAMKRLAKWGYLRQNTASKFTVVTICNWDTYQQDEDTPPPADRQMTASRPPDDRQMTASRPPHLKKEKKVRMKEGEEQEHAAQSADRAIVYSDSFDQFWTAYPKRNGQRVGKKPAFAQWQKLADSDRENATTSLPAYAATCNGHPKDAARFLRDRIFDDVTEPAAEQAPTEWRF